MRCSDARRGTKAARRAASDRVSQAVVATARRRRLKLRAAAKWRADARVVYAHEVRVRAGTGEEGAQTRLCSPTVARTQTCLKPRIRTQRCRCRKRHRSAHMIGYARPGYVDMGYGVARVHVVAHTSFAYARRQRKSRYAAAIARVAAVAAQVNPSRFRANRCAARGRCHAATFARRGGGGRGYAVVHVEARVTAPCRSASEDGEVGAAAVRLVDERAQPLREQRGAPGTARA